MLQITPTPSLGDIMLDLHADTTQYLDGQLTIQFINLHFLFE